MRTILVGISVFTIFVSIQGSANAQLVYLQDPTIPPVLSYLTKFLSMQPRRSTSPAYQAGNRTFFEGFKNVIEETDPKDHLDTLNKMIEDIKAMSFQRAKDIYGIDRNIALAILNGIYEIVHNDSINNNLESTHYVSDDTESSQQNNGLYELEEKTLQGKTYYIYTLIKQNTIKNADFHNKNGSFYHCMYSQCNKVAFESTLDPLEVQAVYSLGGKSETFLLNDRSETTEDTTRSIYDDEDFDEDDFESEEVLSEDDLLEEISDLFGGIL